MTYEAITFQQAPIITFGYIVQIILSLAIVIGLIYISAKYLLPRLQQMTPNGKFMQVTDKMGLEPQATLYTVKAGSQIYLIAVSNKNITLIDKFKEGEIG
ncbi:hypothetical protein A3J90_04655 [candidate division WOR-1 bacterium RIFOXYC2_FULL_37_10]|uniref:Flagellar protein n=1 Tax=candidate division WOR-1 bacterium RIFOXYB2_FULL_37_13 TaxID=1802579 RepID=A0A1F4SLT5_UNCSA|nr:MAG: hypothetical protein A2246_06800 [candidate division WOR-1 bacterium RIFOXYA2_FULL_37_7]OGC21396.1 MAG: hypothetical protein A2310_01355 [candidate division WOR-1 bacterium RIFOXYB2_FULL_37_13]OGC33460.1 MAG: hypothetical protein A3J90_04655 [candidate division WOR-1 bacterium RIFOXYC2_FULL_37_10]